MPRRRALLALTTILALTALASAQQPYVYDPLDETDEFTGQYMCFQRVDNGYEEWTGLGLMRVEGGLGVAIFRDTSWDQPAFNLFQDEALPGDRVYVRFGPNDVVDVVPTGVEVNREADEEWVLLNAPNLARRVVNAATSLRVRFAGSNATHDFTLSGAAVRAVGREFQEACL